MKKNLGSDLSLYPKPAVVVGTMVGERPSWVLVRHLGIIGYDRLLVSLAKACYTHQGIKATGRLSVNFVTHGGGGMARCEADAKKLCPKATWLKKLAVNGSLVDGAASRVEKWLKEIGIAQ